MSGDDQFTERINVRFSASEMRIIEKIANRMGLSLSNTIRTAALAFLMMAPYVPKDISEQIVVKTAGDNGDDEHRGDGGQLHQENVQVPRKTRV